MSSRFFALSRPLIRRAVGDDIVVQLKILRGFKRGHVVKALVAVKIGAAAELQRVGRKDIGAMRRRVHPLRDDGLGKREIGVLGNRRAARRVTKSALCRVEAINRRAGFVANAKVRRNIFGDEGIPDAGQFRALSGRISAVAVGIFVRKEILLRHVFGVMVRGAFQREGKSQRRAFVLDARFVRHEKNRGM